MLPSDQEDSQPFLGLLKFSLWYLYRTTVSLPLSQLQLISLLDDLHSLLMYITRHIKISPRTSKT